VHAIGGLDPYFDAYFEGKNIEEALDFYFDTVLDSVRAPYPYDIIGHIGYLSRYAPAPHEGILDFSDKSNAIIDTILKEIIAREKSLELNTSVKRVKTLTLPDEKILRRYFSLGGEHITFGSDAHQTERIAQNFSAVSEMAKSAGFKYWTVYKNRKREKVRI